MRENITVETPFDRRPNSPPGYLSGCMTPRCRTFVYSIEPSSSGRDGDYRESILTSESTDECWNTLQFSLCESVWCGSKD